MMEFLWLFVPIMAHWTRIKGSRPDIALYRPCAVVKPFTLAGELRVCLLAANDSKA